VNVVETALPEVKIIEPKVWRDPRGFFMETFHHERYKALAGITLPFVQDNWSRSAKGTLRGLHFQNPRAQGKLVQVVRGKVFDVAVDIRKGSPRFGKWVGFELSEENARQLWVPPGFAHGFLTMSETADFVYKCTDTYAPEADGNVIWNDPDIGIEWPDIGMAPILSNKDGAAPMLKDQAKIPSY
jgi:dTDP-4-dehydrorhamnose 3,5-epimerase